MWWGTNSTSNSSGWTGNSSASITGIREILLNTVQSSFSAGMYYVVHGFTQRTSGASVGGINSAFYLSQSQTTGGARLGANTTANPIGALLGSFSVSSNGTSTGYNVLPASIHTSNITVTGGSSQQRIFVPRFNF